MRNGFTIIESLIVISILTLMTVFLVLYNRTGEKQLLLLKEKANIISAIFRAKNLALATFIQEPTREVVCGYGVSFSRDSYFLYKDLAVDCDASDRRYSGDNSGELMNDNVFTVHPQLQIKSLEASDILFAPPTPNIFFDGFAAEGERSITLSDLDDTTNIKIIVNNAGQISPK